MSINSKEEPADVSVVLCLNSQPSEQSARDMCCPNAFQHDQDITHISSVLFLNFLSGTAASSRINSSSHHQSKNKKSPASVACTEAKSPSPLPWRAARPRVAWPGRLRRAWSASGGEVSRQITKDGHFLSRWYPLRAVCLPCGLGGATVLRGPLETQLRETQCLFASVLVFCLCKDS